MDGVYRRLVVAQKAEAITPSRHRYPQGHFEQSSQTLRGTTRETTTRRIGAPARIPTMTVPEICAMPVAELAADDAILWLWVTNPNLRHAYHGDRRLGLPGAHILTWVKPHFGTGHWLRGQTEHCILAVRGRPTVTLTNQATVLHAPAPERRHSRKPDEFYQLVESLCPGSKLELFCRQPRPGWASHGDEAVGDAA